MATGGVASDGTGGSDFDRSPPLLTEEHGPGTVPAMSGPVTYPIVVEMPVDDEQRNRWLAAAGIVLIKVILLLPHILLLFLFGMMIQILAWIGYWGIAFTDRLPDPIRRLEISPGKRLGFLVNRSRGLGQASAERDIKLFLIGGVSSRSD